MKSILFPFDSSRDQIAASEETPVRVDFRSSSARTAIVFLHGFGGNVRTTWADFPRFLVEDPRLSGWDVFSLGYPTSLRPDVRFVWSADPDLGALSLELRTTLAHSPFREYQSLALIVHSMGGLVAQRALLDTRTAARVGHLIMFGTPSAGLYKALLGYVFKRQSRDMTADSVFIRDLRDAWTHAYAAHVPFRLRAVAGDRDEFVPRTSSLDPFPDEVRAVVPGNHLQIVKPTSRDSMSVQIVAELLLPALPVRGAIDSARLAVEEREFAAAIATFESRVDTLDEGALVQLALALDSVERGSEALRLLALRYEGGTTWTDALGVLGGRLKRRWLTERGEDDWVRARSLYTEGLSRAEASGDADQAMYHAINIAFLDLMMSPPDSVVPSAVALMAERALHHSVGACPGYWRLATEAEALAMRGDIDAACGLYAHAIATQPGARVIDTMYTHAVRVMGRVYGEAGQARIERLFQVGGEDKASATSCR